MSSGIMDENAVVRDMMWNARSNYYPKDDSEINNNEQCVLLGENNPMLNTITLFPCDETEHHKTMRIQELHYNTLYDSTLESPPESEWCESPPQYEEPAESPEPIIEPIDIDSEELDDFIGVYFNSDVPPDVSTLMEDDLLASVEQAEEDRVRLAAANDHTYSRERVDPTRGVPVHRLGVDTPSVSAESADSNDTVYSGESGDSDEDVDVETVTFENFPTSSNFPNMDTMPTAQFMQESQQLQQTVHSQLTTNRRGGKQRQAAPARPVGRPRSTRKAAPKPPTTAPPTKRRNARNKSDSSGPNSKRSIHNALERERRVGLSILLAHLRAQIDHLADKPRSPKLVVLNGGKKQIEILDKAELKHLEEKVQLNSRKQVLLETLQMELLRYPEDQRRKFMEKVHRKVDPVVEEREVPEKVQQSRSR